MNTLRIPALIASSIGAAALFGFYFTMSASIMPGLDLTEPYAAITANQDIGRANKQSIFFIALLGTPIVMILGMIVWWSVRSVRNWLGLALLGWVAMLVVTLMLNVPLNQILDGLVITPDQEGLADLWAAYGVDWQKWNWLRVLTSGLSVVFVSFALYASGKAPIQ